MSTARKLLFVLLFIFHVNGVATLARADPLVDILAIVADQKMSNAQQWRALLHYDAPLGGGRESSRAHESSFFLASNGSTDPEAELQATIRAMYENPSDDKNAHVICRFPARFHWITNGKLLPQIECQAYTEWRAAIQPERITLVFPASFLNNPASAFGHTFIRLDHRKDDTTTKLLDYAADFAASTHGESALIYAAKGIFGGYQGFYSIAPYYKKVEKYSDLENRDIWEYDLALTPDEVHMLVAHLWELRQVPFNYFYFDENCSYHILALLDVARPELQLVKSMRMWVIPVDTIRTISRYAGLIRSVVFRPSAATKLRARIANVDKEIQSSARKLAMQEGVSHETSQQNNLADSRRRAAAFDLAYDFLTYERIRTRSDSEIQKKRAWELLKNRSEIALETEPVSTRELAAPESGHRTAMMALGGGRIEDRTVAEFTFRPAFHGLTDPLPGYLPGNQIQFLDTTLQYTEERGVSLQRLTALNITALTPRDEFFRPISWRVNLDYRRIQREGSDPLALGELQVGGGRSYQMADGLLFYGLADTSLGYSTGFDREHAFGVGPRVGILYSPQGDYATELAYTDRIYFTGDSHREQRAIGTQRISLSRNTAIRFELARSSAIQNSGWESMVRLERFFTP